MSDRVIIVGGFSETIELAVLCGKEIVGIVDAHPASVTSDFPILGEDSDARELFDRFPECPVVISPDLPAVRARLAEFYRTAGFGIACLVHPEARISPAARLGAGCIIQDGCYVSSNATLGDLVKLNVAAGVMHDSHVGSHTTIAPGAVVLGRVTIGAGAYIGANATILPGVVVGSESTVGAGAVVVSEVAAGATVVGVPARELLRTAAEDSAEMTSGTESTPRRRAAVESERRRDSGSNGRPFPAVREARVSVVVPVRNEGPNIRVFSERVTRALSGCCRDWEVIFVEDSSTDDTVNEIEGTCADDERFKALFLTRSFGHHEALTAGVDRATGDYIVTMDGDLEHPPELIPALLARCVEGFDVVAARRQRSQGGVKELGSRILNATLAWLSDHPVDLSSTMYRAFTRRVADTLSDMPERRRFVPGMLAWPGFAVSEIPFANDLRREGRTKYGFGRMVTLAANAITSFTIKPLRFGILLGLAFATLSFLAAAYYIVRFLTVGVPVQGYTSLIVAVFFVGGLILLVLGIVGEYVGGIFEEVKNRPLYVVRSTINLSAHRRGSRV